MRVTKTNLLVKLAVIKQCNANYEDWDINYSSAYGGYQITSNNGSSIVRHRASAKDTNSFLEGVLEAVGC